MTLNCLTRASLDLEKLCHRKENVFSMTYGNASVLWYYSLCLKKKNKKKTGIFSHLLVLLLPL